MSAVTAEEIKLIEDKRCYFDKVMAKLLSEIDNITDETKLQEVGVEVDKCKAVYDDWSSHSSELIDTFSYQMRSEGMPESGQTLSKGWEEVGRMLKEATTLMEKLTAMFEHCMGIMGVTMD